MYYEELISMKERVEVGIMPFEFDYSDIAESKSSCIVNTVNCVGVMGKGVAKAVKKKFPWSVSPYVEHCKNNLLSPGDILPVSLTVESKQKVIHYPTIIHAATKDHWRRMSKLEWVESCLIRINEYLTINRVKSISIPKLGCGLGGLEWKIVEQLYDKYLSIEDCLVTIFDFNPDTEKSIDPQQTLQFIEEE